MAPDAKLPADTTILGKAEAMARFPELFIEEPVAEVAIPVKEVVTENVNEEGQ